MARWWSEPEPIVVPSKSRSENVTTRFHQSQRRDTRPEPQIKPTIRGSGFLEAEEVRGSNPLARTREQPSVGSSDRLTAQLEGRADGSLQDVELGQSQQDSATVALRSIRSSVLNRPLDLSGEQLVASPPSGSSIAFIDSALKYRRSPVAHSSSYVNIEARSVTKIRSEILRFRHRRASFVVLPWARLRS